MENDIKKLKEEYSKNPNKWVVYHILNEEWQKTKDAGNLGEIHDNSRLILKEHEHIADAVVANPDVEMELLIGNKWFELEDFFDVYDSNNNYRLAKPQCDGKFSGGYIKANLDRKTLEFIFNDLGKLKWLGNDDGWDEAISAVRRKLYKTIKETKS